MPYSGVDDPETVAKIDDCVDKVMATGKDKSAAIAICRASIEKGVDCPGCPPRARPKAKASRAAIRHRDRTNGRKAALLRAVADAIDDEEAEVLGIDPDVVLHDADEMPDVRPAPVAKAMLPEDDSEDEMEDDGTAGVDLPAPMPSSLEAMQAARDAAAEAAAAARLVQDYHMVVEGIVGDPAITDKGAAVVREAGVFARLWGRVRAGLATLGEKIGARHSKADTDAIQAVHDHAAMLGAMCTKAAEGGSAFALTKATDGYRWLGVVSNNFKDRDGEIITAEAHREFMAHLDAHPEDAPAWYTWHTDIGRKSRADLWDYVDGFVVMSGPAEAEDAARYAQAAAPLGMSHGFRGEKQGALITRYRSFEVSDLPADAAANPWTEFTVLQQEAKAMAFDPKKREYMVKLFGEDMTAQLEGEAASRAKELQEQGVQHKEADTAPVEAAPVAVEAAPAEVAPPAPVAEPAAPALTEAHLKALTDGIAALLGEVEQLKTANMTQAAQIAELKGGLDARVAEALAPRVAPQPRGVGAGAPETLAGADHPLVQQARKEASADWLVKALQPAAPGGA